MRRILFVASVFAAMNLGGLLVGIGYAWQQGWLERDRVRAAVSILRGESAENLPTSEIEEPESGLVKGDTTPRTIQQTSDLIRESREAQERMRIEFARREREIQDGFRLWEARQLALLREKEALEEEKRRVAVQQEAVALAAGDDGVQREVETLAGIPPRNAKELLLAKDEAEAAQILKIMDQRKLNKIVKECKSEEERRWIGRILERFHQTSTAQAEDLDAG